MLRFSYHSNKYPYHNRFELDEPVITKISCTLRSCQDLMHNGHNAPGGKSTHFGCMVVIFSVAEFTQNKLKQLQRASFVTLIKRVQIEKSIMKVILFPLNIHCKYKNTPSVHKEVYLQTNLHIEAFQIVLWIIEYMNIMNTLRNSCHAQQNPHWDFQKFHLERGTILVAWF